MKKAQTETEDASGFLWRGLIAIAVIWIIAVAPMIYVGETTLWASAETKAGPPSIEILPSDKWMVGGISRRTGK
jgi:hypothetical protein